MFKKVLIANRGEIAVRIIRACRDRGIASVAVYSEVDRGALHVRLADEALPIGPAPSAESYLHIDRILEAARAAGVDAIHPGYGFLSENALFAQAVEDAGFVFIGPPAAAIELMGSKIESRRTVERSGIPTVPGTTDPIASEAEAMAIAERIGYPLMLKASAGGGGKGLRRVDTPGEMASALRTTRSEAKTAFGDDAVYIERLIERPRHIEIQVLADRHGHAIHLGERECSIQRRHQKVIEECPSPVVDDALRDAMGRAALAVVRAAGYSNAGTVEFLLDPDGRFYFLEMNTRLQVEHATTEMVTGIDLVDAQLRIAAGDRLALVQDEVHMSGHAIECRIYAEDPDNRFFPSPGRILRLQSPSGPGVRDDTGVYEGWEVPLEYDPMISKLIAWAPSRQEAIGRMRRALAEYRIEGVRNNLGFFRAVLEDARFEAAEFDTGFIDRWLRDREPPTPDPRMRDLALAVAAAHQVRSRTPAALAATRTASAWKREGRRDALEGR